MSYDRPGNVRELYQALETALVSSMPNPILFSKDLPVEIRAKAARKSVGEKPVARVDESPEKTNRDGHGEMRTLHDVRNEALSDVERHYLRNLMRKTEGKVRRACRISGLSRKRLYTLLKKYDIRAHSSDRQPQGEQ